MTTVHAENLTNGFADCEHLAEQFRTGTPQGLPEEWPHDPAVHEAHRMLARRFLDELPSYPGHFQGRGVVICAGGARLFTNAWVCIRMLRERGCTLPVQVWYLGPGEMDCVMQRLLEPYGVECIDAEEMSQLYPARILNGWEVKPFAILHCPFREVLLLDADNVAVIDPTFLFETKEYREHGAIFWPDYGRLAPDRSIWEICEVDYRDEPEFESGQIVVDKKRCWEALNLTMHYNEHSDFYYNHVHGDKETFHMAFRRAEKSFAMPSCGIHSLEATMCQHDFSDRRLFQHRNMDKWSFQGTNRRVEGFIDEERCLLLVSELSRHWPGRVWWNDVPTKMELSLLSELGNRVYEYHRVGFDKRLIELRRDRTIARGAADNEQEWTVSAKGGSLVVIVYGYAGPTCCLSPQGGSWTGRWLRHERMPVSLSPVT